eukprot:1161472-Pelagomonas_calceolata.AAC.7
MLHSVSILRLACVVILPSSHHATAAIPRALPLAVCLRGVAVQEQRVSSQCGSLPAATHVCCH